MASKKNKNERPPTIGVQSAAEGHPELDQQISKLKKNAEKRFDDAQNKAQIEAEKAKRQAKIESEVESMYGSQAASTVNESDRYKASVKKSDEENALLRPEKDEITVEDAIAAYGDYIADDGYVANDQPIEKSGHSIDRSFTDIPGSTLPEMPKMESMSFSHNYSYDAFGMHPASSEKQHPQGMESVRVAEPATGAGSSNANSVPFTNQFIRNEETQYDKSALGEAQAEYDQKMREHPDTNGFSGFTGQEPYTHDPYFHDPLTLNAVGNGSVTSFLKDEKAPDSQPHDISEQPLDTPDYSVYDAYRSQQELERETSVGFSNEQHSEDKVSYTNLSNNPEISDHSSVGIAQKEYDQRMHEKPAPSNGYNSYRIPDANVQTIKPEDIISDGSGKYYSAKTNEVVYKNGDGSFVKGSKAVELGIVSQEQYNVDRASESFRYNSSQSLNSEAVHTIHTERPLVNTETEGVLTDGDGRFYSRETREVLYKADDGNYYNSERAIEKGIVTQAQVDLERRNDFSHSRESSSPVISNDGGIYTHQAQAVQENKGSYDRSGVGIAQQEYEQRLSHKPGYHSIQDRNLSGFPELTKEQQYTSQQSYIVTDGNGHYYDHDTKEVVYKGTDGTFHNADEAIRIGLVTKEEATKNQLNQQSYIEYAAKDSAQLFDGTKEHAHSDLVGEQPHYKSAPELYKTENNDVLTDGRGRFYNSKTKEIVYKSADNQYLNAEKAIKAGIITNEQATADRFDNTAEFARVIDKESPTGYNTEINHTAGDFERRSSHSGLDIAQHEYEQRMAEKPAGRSFGSPIAPQHINSEFPVLTRTNTDGVLTDGAGRYYKADTKEILYKGNDGNYFNAEKAIVLGITSKEQVAADRTNNTFFSGHASDKFVQAEYNASIPAEHSKIQDVERSGLGIAQQEFEYRMSEKAGKSYNHEPSFAGQYLYKPEAELKVYTDGILTDEAGHFYRSDTREIVYKNTDGQFLNAEKAVELGIVTREQANADHLRFLNSSSQMYGIETDQSGTSFRNTTSKFDDHSGLGIAQQEYEQRLSEKPGHISIQLERTNGFSGYTAQSDRILKGTQTDGILTDGNGRFYRSDTNELVYKGADGKYHDAEKAVELGIVSRSQVENDLTVKFDSKQAQFDPGVGFTEKYINKPDNGLKVYSDGILTDSDGRFYKADTGEVLYRNTDGEFLNAEKAVALGIVSKDQVSSDRMNIDMRTSQMPGSYVTGSAVDRSVIGMAQQDYEYGLVDKNRNLGNAETHFAERYIYRPDRDLKPYADGILTDDSGRFYKADTKEVIYRSTDGKFLNAEKAIELGIITKDQAAADHLAHISYDSQSLDGYVSIRNNAITGRSSEEHGIIHDGDRSGFSMSQQEFEYRMADKKTDATNTGMPFVYQPERELKPYADGVLTDGNGKFYKADTKEVIYRSTDGKFLDADKAIKLGIVSQSQVEADRTINLKAKSITTLQHNVIRADKVIANRQKAFYDSQTCTRLYKNEDGSFVDAKDAIKLGLIDENQARYDIESDNRFGRSQVIYQSENKKFVFMDSADSLKDKAKLISLRKEIGFGANTSGFIADEAYNSTELFIARDKQYYVTKDAAFVQSRIFKARLSHGLSPEEAYLQSKKVLLKMTEDGHTAESIIASFTPSINKEDIEFLKRNGSPVLKKGESVFAVGQRHGKRAATGAIINTEAEKIAFRITDRDGRPISNQTIGRFKIAPDAKTVTGVPPGKAKYDRSDAQFIHFEAEQPLGSKTDKKSKSIGKDIDPHDIDLFDDIDAPSNSILKDDGNGKKIDAGIDDGNTDIGVVRHNLYHPSGRTAAIARGSKSIMLGVGMMGMNIFYSAAGESASGLRKTQDYIDVAKLTIGMTAVNTARRIINRPNAFELNGLLKSNGATTLLAYKQSLNKRFAKVGIKPFSTGLSGTALVIAAQKQMLAIKTEMARKGQTAALKEAYAVAKAFRKVGLLTVYAKTPHKIKLSHRVFRLGSLGFRMLMASGGESFRGVDTVMRYGKNAMMAGKAFLFASQHSAKLGIYAVGGIINQSGKIATKTGGALVKAATKTGGKGLLLTTGKVLEKYGSGVKKVSTAKRRLGKKVNHIRQDGRTALKDPFGIKRKIRQQINALMTKAWAKMTARFGWLNKIGKGAKVISHISSVISTIVSAVSQVIFFLFGIFILFIAILLIINMTIPVILSLFNFGSYDETVQDIIVQQLKDCYEEDVQKMLDISADYSTATIDYDDTFRDLDKYTEHKSEADAASFNQSTNCAEIIAMTLVRFEYDVDDAAGNGDAEASKREIQKYVKELYYGSHELYVDVTATTYQVDTGRNDAEGNPIYETRVRKDAALTYRTYYFEYMFDESTVTLGRSETPVIYTGDVDGGSSVYGSVTSWDDMYVNMRQNGFTHEGACGMMANLAYETAGGQAWWTEADIRRNFINTTLVSNDGYESYGIVQWTGGRKTNLINWCLENNYDHTTIVGQLAFMYYEMRTSYSGTYNYLRTSGNSAYNCGRYVADHYEVCAMAYRPGRATLAETFASMYAAYKDDYSDLVKAGDAIVQYALQYVGRIHYTQGFGSYIGTRYLGPDLDQAVYSGSGTPTIGTDCSGFVYSVHKHFGITTPTSTHGYTTANQISLTDIQPGDILWRAGHVAIYIGNGQIVQASTCYGGSHSGDLNVASYNASAWTCAYRYWQ